MNKEYIKYMFLLSFLSIATKSMWEGFDIASGFAMLITGCLVFAYDTVENNKRLNDVKVELSSLSAKNEEIIKEIQQLKTNRNIQKISSPQVGMGSGNFPPRLG